jgi:hypothetical protein
MPTAVTPKASGAGPYAATLAFQETLMPEKLGLATDLVGEAQRMNHQ